MVLVTDLQFSMDSYLVDNLNIAKDVIKNDWDFCFIVGGIEGSGKSTLAQQCAYYCDPTFNMSRITFTPMEFEAAILKADKYQAIVYDEAYTGLSSRGVMTGINKSIVNRLAEIRQKNLFLFVVMPTFFDLDRYVAIWRSRALIHIYTGEDWSRGFYEFYNVERKKNLYLTGKKLYHYDKDLRNFWGTFSRRYVVDELEYRNRKLQAMNSPKTSKEDMKFAYALKVICRMSSQSEASNLLHDAGYDVTQERISQILNNLDSFRGKLTI